MRKAATVVAACVLLVAGGTYLVFGTSAASHRPVEANDVTLTGRLSCTFCTLANPSMPCPAGCCMDCVKGGDPPLLTDAQGNMYLLLSGEKGATLMTPERLAMVGGQVTIKGLLVSRNGIRVIYVDSIEKVNPASQ
jgi:hypothetical protein